MNSGLSRRETSMKPEIAVAGGRRWPAWVFWGLAALPLLFLATFVYRYYVDVPYWDDWILVPFFEKYYQGRLTWQDFWGFNQCLHRVPFAYALNVAMALASGWRMSWELTSQLIGGIALFAIVLYQVRRSFESWGLDYRSWMLPVISLMIFSMSQRTAWMIGFHVHYFMNAAFATMAIVLLCQPVLSWLRLFLAAAFSMVATCSVSNGLACWPIGLCILLLHEDKRGKMAAVWGVIAVIACAVYLHSFDPAEFTPPGGEIPKTRLALVVSRFLYGCIFLGSPMVPYSRKGAFVMGLVGFAGSLWLVWRLLRYRGYRLQELMPFLAIGSYVLSSMALNVLGRGAYGTYFALHARYIVITTLFWISVMALAYLWVYGRNSDISSSRRRWVTAGAAAFVGLLLLGSVHGCVDWMKWRPELIAAQKELKAGVEGPAWASLFPWKEMLRERTEVIKRHRLSVFRTEASGPPAVETQR